MTSSASILITELKSDFKANRKCVLKVLFLGTPEFAVPTLNELIVFPKTEVVGVVCQPDRPAGRGNKVHVPPVKEVAVKHKPVDTHSGEIVTQASRETPYQL